jgi:hypothetical protein
MEEYELLGLKRLFHIKWNFLLAGLLTRLSRLLAAK